MKHALKMVNSLLNVLSVQKYLLDTIFNFRYRRLTFLYDFVFLIGPPTPTREDNHGVGNSRPVRQELLRLTTLLAKTVMREYTEIPTSGVGDNNNE